MAKLAEPLLDSAAALPAERKSRLGGLLPTFRRGGA
jgi:hypothetical protein